MVSANTHFSAALGSLFVYQRREIRDLLISCFFFSQKCMVVAKENTVAKTTEWVAEAPKSTVVVLTKVLTKNELLSEGTQSSLGGPEWEVTMVVILP